MTISSRIATLLIRYITLIPWPLTVWLGTIVLYPVRRLTRHRFLQIELWKPKSDGYWRCILGPLRMRCIAWPIRKPGLKMPSFKSCSLFYFNSSVAVLVPTETAPPSTSFIDDYLLPVIIPAVVGIILLVVIVIVVVCCLKSKKFCRRKGL